MSPLVFYQYYTPAGVQHLLGAAGFAEIEIETPGETDVQTVREVLGRPDPCLGRFLNHVLFDDSAGAEERRGELQRVLAANGWSGHMLVTARKPR